MTSIDPKTVDPQTLPYRACVGLCIFNDRGEVFIAERTDKSGAWQMPQGGINKHEEPRLAALRELKEEIGTAAAEILAEAPEKLRYDFPNYLQYRHGLFRGKYRGQEQTWFALRFTGSEDDICLSGHDGAEAEFSNWRWATLQEAVDLIVEFKRPVYARMAEIFEPIAAALAKGKKPPTL
ncbi:MAG: RNA pyrophosphohydrolase [Alphaproteobacteria bacterium]|nr:RNA pyrophosphohydrolase [Alphaproteobacteria bacterium]